MANPAASSDTGNTQPDYPAHISEMQEIRAMLAAMTASPMQSRALQRYASPPALLPLTQVMHMYTTASLLALQVF